MKLEILSERRDASVTRNRSNRARTQDSAVQSANAKQKFRQRFATRFARVLDSLSDRQVGFQRLRQVRRRNKFRLSRNRDAPRSLAVFFSRVSLLFLASVVSDSQSRLRALLSREGFMLARVADQSTVFAAFFPSLLQIRGEKGPRLGGRARAIVER